MQKEESWFYKNFLIREGLRPGSKHFQYFFIVSEGDTKRCNYCVWIDDDALSRFTPSREYGEICASQRDVWRKWVQGKIDQGDFTNRVLKFEKTGRREIDLTDLQEKLEFE